MYVETSIKKHAIFERDGKDLYCQIPISFPKAALGGETRVVTIDGKNLSVKIPPGSQNGDKLRLKGKGMPSARYSGIGDLICEIYVETPTDLSKNQKELLAQFEESMTQRQLKKSSSWMDKIKGFMGS